MKINEEVPDPCSKGTKTPFPAHRPTDRQSLRSPVFEVSLGSESGIGTGTWDLDLVLGVWQSVCEKDDSLLGVGVCPSLLASNFSTVP